jgi:hypothetical protein
MHSSITYSARPSHGWVWLLGVSLALLGLTVGFTVPLWSETPAWARALNLAIGLGFGVPGLILARWARHIRYEVTREALVLRCGPLALYRIPLGEIRSIKRRDLAITLWSSLRLPGLALLGVPYADVGTVKMCATAAADRILLIETDKAKYGLTPADEEGFVAALRARMEG